MKLAPAEPGNAPTIAAQVPPGYVERQNLTMPGTKRTPAMAAGVSDRIWSATDIAALLD